MVISSAYDFELMIMLMEHDHFVPPHPMKGKTMANDKSKQPKELWILEETPPTEEQIRESLIMFELYRDDEPSLLDALKICVKREEVLWLKAMFHFSIGYVLSDNREEYFSKAKITHFPDTDGAGPAGFDELFNEFASKILDPSLEECFQVGTNFVSHRAVCRANRPSPRELASMWNLIGRLVRAGVPILSILKIVGESQTHPHLIAICSIAREEIRKGNTMARGIRDGILRFTRTIVERYLRQNPQDLEDQPVSNIGEYLAPGMTDIAEESGTLYDSPSNPKPFNLNPDDWYLPNILGYLDLDLNMIDVGEITGELDDCLLSLAHQLERQEENSPIGVDDLVSAKVKEVLLSFADLVGTGLPYLRALIILRNKYSGQAIGKELAGIVEYVESGNELSEAFKLQRCAFSRPLIVALTKAGESSGNLERIFKDFFCFRKLKVS